MPQLASLSWFFFSLFFVVFLLLVCVSIWWFSYSKTFCLSFLSASSFNGWDW